MPSTEKMTVLVKMKFRHNCDDWPENFDRHITFIEGVEYEVPADVGQYFIDAGWCCKPEDADNWTPPEKNKVVLLDAHNGSLGQKATDA